MIEFIRIFIDFAVYLFVGTLASWFYLKRNKKILGGIWGGLIIGTLGAVSVAFVAAFQGWFNFLIEWLITPKFNGVFLTRVNLLAAILGAFLFIQIWLEIHNRDS